MIQFALDRPIYLQIGERIATRIMTGEYPPGSKLPSVRDLASSFGVNPNTMQRALADLETRNLLYAERTTGRFVTEDTAVITAAKRQHVEQLVHEFINSLKVFGYDSEGIAKIIQQVGKEETK